MHELSVVQGLLRILEEEAARNHAGRVVRVHLQVGLLSCVEYRTLTGCFEICAEGTVAEGAELVCETMPVHAVCKACGHRFEMMKRRFFCPECGSDELELSGGRDLVVAAIDAQEAQEAQGAQA